MLAILNSYKVVVEYLQAFFKFNPNTACPPFTFKDTLSNTDVCQPCPLFSNTTENDTAVTVCPCDPGYYMAVNEAALPCTSEGLLMINMML